MDLLRNWGVHASDAAAIYAAGLSTVVALSQGFVWLRNKPRLEVVATLSWQGLRDQDREMSRGTPVVVKRGDDDLLEQVLISITVRNRGGRAIQISSVLVETLANDSLQAYEIVPSALPQTIDPEGSVVVTIQKEFLDDSHVVTFLGVLDALGRRHAVEVMMARNLIEASWALPTRVATYRRRDDPNKEVRAFQTKDRFSMSRRPVAKMPSRIATRSEGTINHESN